MRRDLLVNALSGYSLEDIMSMVGESHQISKERKEIPQEMMQQLADELKSMKAINTVHIPIDVKGTLKVDLSWYGSEDIYAENFEFEIDTASNNEGASCIEYLVKSISEDSIEDIPSESLKKIIKRKDAFRDQVLEVAEKYHADEWDLHSDITNLIDDRENPPRRRKRRMRMAKKRRI